MSAYREIFIDFEYTPGIKVEEYNFIDKTSETKKSMIPNTNVQVRGLTVSLPSYLIHG
jgi:hypothetical protein